jgi:uncharacterized repeat protein (TIGR01451 family)/fimbrial isopeptide formation D2 family protein
MSHIVGLPPFTTVQPRIVPARHPALRTVAVLFLAALVAVPLLLNSERLVSSAAPIPSPSSLATPTVTLTGPGQVLSNTQFKFKVTFKSSGAVGYAPFEDVVLDAGGANIAKSGNCPCDGITFIKAEMVGVNGGNLDLTPQTVINSSPCANVPTTFTHPFAGSLVQPVVVPAGAQLITIPFPFGSYDATQPPIEIEITAKVSLWADVSYPLKISARGGFRFGLNPLDDPLTDPPILTDENPPGTQIGNSTLWAAQTQVKPVVMIATKTYLGPEGETTTGPNFTGYYPLTYHLGVQIAPGQTATNVVLKDCLPNNLAFHQIASITPPGAATLPLIDQAGSSPNCLIVHWNSLSGVGSVDFQFFIPEMAGGGNPVLPVDCASAISLDELTVEADWAPVDPCDGPSRQIKSGPVFDRLQDKCIAIQKSVTLATDTGAPGYSPGDVLKYTLNFQVSDYRTIGSIDISDRLSDGQQALTGPGGYAPSLVVWDKLGIGSGDFITGSDLIVTPDSTIPCGGIIGGTRLDFRVSQKLANLSLAYPRLAAGIMTGGWAAGPPSPVPATGQIVFFARITDKFMFSQPGDPFVDKEDPVTNCAEIGGKVMTNVASPAMPVSTGITAQDDSSTAIRLVGDTLKKTIYAVSRANLLGVFSLVCGPGGPACANRPNPPQEVLPGDRVTYRLEKLIPSSDAENLTVEDWLPRPVFDVTGDTFTNAACGTPAPGHACLGPTNTLTTPVLSAGRPVFIAAPATNSIKFDFGTFNDPTNTPHKIDLLVTQTVGFQPMADDLFLTNEAQECEQNTFGGAFCQIAIAQVNLREPKLRIRKGVIATNNPNGLFSQPATPQTTPNPTAQPPAGATLTLGGIAGVVNSTDLANGRLNSDLSNVDANDVATFAVTIENQGGAPAYDAKFEDVIPNIAGSPSCFTIIPNSFQIKRGTGAAVLPGLYTLTQSATGFTLASTVSAVPISAYHPTNGSNIVVVTFQAKLMNSVLPGCCKNVATIDHYAASAQGPDFVAAGFNQPYSDTADLCVRPTLTKSLVTTSEAHTALSNVTIGEIVRYRLLLALPEGGTLTNFQVTDTLPPGLGFIPDNTARIAFVSDGAGINRAPVFTPAYNWPGGSPPSNMSLNGMPQMPPTAIAGGTGCGVPVTFALGQVQNHDNDSDLEYIVIEFNTLVCNQASNQNGVTLPNTFNVLAGNITSFTSPAVNVTVVEPNLTITKTASSTTVVQGGTFNYSVQITNNGAATAFEPVITDTLPPGVNFSGPVSITPAALGCTGSVGGQVLTVNCAKIPNQPNPNSTVTISYPVAVHSPGCPVKVANRASVNWTSLPGPKGTINNPTMSNSTTNLVLGNSGFFNGERDGVTAPPTMNDYAVAASVTVNVSCPACVPPPQGMVGWWPFDESNGATAMNDLALVNNQGAPKPGSTLGGANAPSAVPGMVGGATNFNSGNQSTGPNIEVPDHPELNFGTGDLSIDSWVLVPPPPSVMIHPLVDKLQMNAAGTQGTGYALTLVSSSAAGARIQFVIGGGGPLATYLSAAGSLVPFNTWTHVTVTVNRSGGAVVFYLNGVAVAASAATMPTASITNSLPLLIGESRALGLVQGVIAIDELEIFKRKLLQTEVQSIVNAGAGGKCKCLRASNEVFTCAANGSFNYTFTVTNQSAATINTVNFGATGVVFSPNTVSIPPLAPGASTSVTVNLSGPGAVAGGDLCFTVGLSGGPAVPSCRTQHCIKLPVCQSGCATRPTGMVGWWPLNEGVGAAVTTDIIGNHNGTPTIPLTAMHAQPGKVAGGLFITSNFDVSVPDNPALKFGTGNFSIDAWYGSSQPGLVGGVIDKLDTGAKKGYALYVQGNRLKFVMGDGSNLFTYTSVASVGITSGSSTWHLLAVTVDRAGNTGTFYIDGVLAGNFTPPAAGINIATVTPLLIGGSRQIFPVCVCEYLLDEVEVFNSLVSPADIKAIFSAGPKGKCKPDKVITIHDETGFVAPFGLPLVFSLLRPKPEQPSSR